VFASSILCFMQKARKRTFRSSSPPLFSLTLLPKAGQLQLVSNSVFASTPSRMRLPVPITDRAPSRSRIAPSERFPLSAPQLCGKCVLPKTMPPFSSATSTSRQWGSERTHLTFPSHRLCSKIAVSVGFSSLAYSKWPSTPAGANVSAHGLSGIEISCTQIASQANRSSALLTKLLSFSGLVRFTL